MHEEIGGIKYFTSGKLDAFTKLKISRKLAPAIPVVEGLVALKNKDKDRTLLTVIMLSHVSDADSEFIMKQCLGVVLRVDETGHPAPVFVKDSLMYDDIELADLLKLTLEVIEENLGDFFRTALDTLDKQAKAKDPE